MEILNILYSNNLIAVYLIGAILVVILIFIVVSSMSTTPKENKKILSDPTEEEINPNILEVENIKEEKIETPEIPKINDIVENIYQKSLEIEQEEKNESNDLNSFLEQFDVPENVIEEVVHNDEVTEIEKEPIKIQLPEETEVINEVVEDVETPRLKDNHENTENIEDMLKRLYELRQTENDNRKNAILNEIYDLKKQVDEALKDNVNNYNLDYNYIDTKALADYYLFNEDIEFPKLK